jgi:hypothetical protein
MTSKIILKYIGHVYGIKSLGFDVFFFLAGQWAGTPMIRISIPPRDSTFLFRAVPSYYDVYVLEWFLTFCFLHPTFRFVKQYHSLSIENQIDALFIFNLLRHSTSTCFGSIYCPSSGGIHCICAASGTYMLYV